MATCSLRGCRVVLLAVLLAACGSAAVVPTPAVNADNGTWTPADWEDIDALEVLTTGPDEGEYWSKLWLVVIDDQLFVRLGTRATERIERNTTAPYVSVRIAGQRFDRVRAQHVPEFRERVAKAMGKKYWTDLIIRFFPHPMTIRLIPETQVTRRSTGHSRSILEPNS